tara:strand:- start:598 stop:849 length:252 start_codon:yes stop_codon:yes gene_type:complete
MTKTLSVNLQKEMFGSLAKRIVDYGDLTVDTFLYPSGVGSGQTFDPDITQAVRILEIQDAVYAHARQSGLTNGPHPMDPPPAH